MAKKATSPAAKPVISPAKLVQPIHFEDYDGRNFERLVFAYHLRAYRWRTLEWYGQVGSDMGRDIWGVRLNDASKDESICIQCANRKGFATTKAIRDINKVLAISNTKPDVFRLVCASSVSAESRDKIKKHAKKKGIPICEIWSGTEFEESLRARCEPLLARFVEGVPFPDSPKELKMLTEEAKPPNDEEILAMIARVFDRPAFHTPFDSESSIPAFRQAITDTIQALNTGIWQTRDGKEIARIPSRHMLRDVRTKTEMAMIAQELAVLRARFDDLLKKREIKHCSCNVPDCPVYFFSSKASREMDELRGGLLSRFSRICPQFVVKCGW